MTLEELSITLNELRIAYPKLTYNELKELVKAHKIPYYSFITSGFIKHNVVSKQGGMYYWCNEPVHIKKIELILEEARNYLRGERPTKVAKEPKQIDIAKIIISKPGYTIERVDKEISHDDAIKIAKLLGWKIYKQL